MKISINLSQPIYDRLGEVVKQDNTNASVVCEAALTAYEHIPREERLRIQREILTMRRPQTAHSWRTHFWPALAGEFGEQDMAADDDRYLMAARVYRGIQVIYDAAYTLRPGHENEIIVFIDTAPPYTENTVRLSMSWTFNIGESVFEAARKVGGWIKANAHRLDSKATVEPHN